MRKSLIAAIALCVVLSVNAFSQSENATVGGTVQDSTGALIDDPGWSRQRQIRPEDIEATIYSALGIDWTIVRHDDPLQRGFEYVPFSDQDLYGPVNELWQS